MELNNLKQIVDNNILKLQEIVSKTKKYNKYNTDLRAKSLVDEIHQKIKLINIQYLNFQKSKLETTKNELSIWLEDIEQNINKYEKIYQKLLELEKDGDD